MRHLRVAAFAALAIGLFAGCDDSSTPAGPPSIPPSNSTTQIALVNESFALKQVKYSTALPLARDREANGEAK